MMIRKILQCPIYWQPMERRIRHGVEIDMCMRCRGAWLEQGELETIIQRSGRFLEVPGGPRSRGHPGHRRDEFFEKGFEWF